MKTILLFLFLSVNCFSQQLYRQAFSGGYTASTNGKSLVGEAFNRTYSDGNLLVGESILYQIAVLNALSIDEVNSQNTTLVVYPNPVENELFIQHQDITQWQVQIYDVTGKELKRVFVNQGSINLNFLSSGTYYLIFANEEKSVTVTKKIIKQ
ncbi:Por secretion system C-terminal sorting domain-containing protein [Flavobacterium sp. 9AF]|uniref:T9SS type A sorting domain-containing protein n=1 Tax=Flavobacterium sp. 9AF TaxID=2653142 RepID=UPI0012F17C45|nr:T9SS type A sorting domain-containing protein [Flavobacterium sp. 9AF]VXB34383.1 Por secretion system C-terminal sorting domain-containing protein [Flavobacterium sp. 9AF]